MALAGYPKTYDHPKVHKLEEGLTTLTGTFMLIKTMGNLSTDWIEYKLKYPTSDDPTEEHTIRVTVGGALHGPFSSVRHSDEGSNAQAGGTGTGRSAYSLIYEVED